MRRVFALLAAGVALSLAAPAAAAAIRAAEAKKVFFGFDMAGYVEGANIPWRECIEAAGNTSYWYDGAFDEGRLRVRDDGALCFTYASRNFTDEGCYSATRIKGGNWRFVSVDDPGSVFVTTRAQRAKQCPGAEAAVS